MPILLINKKQKKTNRMIYLGWMISQFGRTKQVRCSDGGGSRKVQVSKWANKKDLIELGKQIFFPKNVSKHGTVSDFYHNLVDFQKTYCF
jgi:cytochrome c peroxidase